MEFNQNINDIIDSYLLGEMQGEELLEFENEIVLNHELAKEIKEQKIIIELINEYNVNKELKNKLNRIHNELDIKPAKVKKERKLLYYFYNTSIAATVALIATFSFLYSRWVSTSSL